MKYEIHNRMHYEMPSGIKRLYFALCDRENGCTRDLRPIQCRTYPMEPHLIDDVLSLVIEKDQIHSCPLIDRRELWRKEFIRGVCEGWKLLLEIPAIRRYIKHLTEARQKTGNISFVINV